MSDQFDYTDIMERERARRGAKTHYKGIPYPRTECESRELLDRLDEELYRAERLCPVMHIGCDMSMPKTQTIYRDTLPPVIPTNKKLLI